MIRNNAVVNHNQNRNPLTITGADRIEAGCVTFWLSQTQSNYLAGLLGVAVLYVATAKLGFLLAIHPGNVTAVWPPSGIALAALLIGGQPFEGAQPCALGLAITFFRVTRSGQRFLEKTFGCSVNY